MTVSYRFDPVDIERLRQIARLTPGGRIRLMLNARELAVGLIRGRLRRRYPDLSPVALNLKLLEELDAAEKRTRFEVETQAEAARQLSDAPDV